MTMAQRLAQELLAYRGLGVAEVANRLDDKLARAKTSRTRAVLAALLDAFCDLLEVGEGV